MVMVAPRVALYTRVSTEDQAIEGFSLDAQLERLRLYAKAQEWIIAGEFVDEGHSGRTTRRPAYQAMMKARDIWDTLLVLKMDRIHRNSRNFMAMMDLLTREGKGFASVTESLDTTTAIGRFVMDIIQRIAQLESEQTGERTYMGQAEKAKQEPHWAPGKTPLGYERLPDRTFVHSPDAPLRKAMALGYRDGRSFSDLAAELNVRGVLSPRGRRWTGEMVRVQVLHPNITDMRIFRGQCKLRYQAPILTYQEYDDVLRRAGRLPRRVLKPNANGLNAAIDEYLTLRGFP